MIERSEAGFRHVRSLSFLLLPPPPSLLNLLNTTVKFNAGLEKLLQYSPPSLIHLSAKSDWSQHHQKRTTSNTHGSLYLASAKGQLWELRIMTSSQDHIQVTRNPSDRSQLTLTPWRMMQWRSSYIKALLAVKYRYWFRGLIVYVKTCGPGREQSPHELVCCALNQRVPVWICESQNDHRRIILPSCLWYSPYHSPSIIYSLITRTCTYACL